MRRTLCLTAALAALCLSPRSEAQGQARDKTGHDFIDEALLLYRVVACAESAVQAPGAMAPAQPAAPTAGQTARSWEEQTAGVVAAHCKIQRERLGKFRTKYVDKARPFLTALEPADLPTRVVYPFGGGDLVSALITYPQAAEVTTISLEHAGDPRRLSDLSAKQLQSSLSLYRDSVGGLLRNHDSASENMRKLERGPIPGQLSFFLQALVILDYEPVSLRFFRVADDGSIHYLDQAEIAQLEKTRATRKSKSWIDTDYSVAFSNAELHFRRRGTTGPILVHRHIAANLSDQHFPDSPVHKHLVAKGKIATMTKAASYLLWLDSFSRIRDYLLQNMVFMVSDSTGIPPRHAARAGFEQITYGRFTGSFLPASDWTNKEFVRLWTGQKYRVLPFRYGYPDAAGNVHMMITRPRTGVRDK